MYVLKTKTINGKNHEFQRRIGVRGILCKSRNEKRNERKLSLFGGKYE